VYGALAILDWTGIGERIYLATSILWLLFASLHLRAIALHVLDAPDAVDQSTPL
jgi:hypothetical protein